ncbi:Rha family transcriptional regulator [Enterococcus hirae]|nr:Rha family transcriptional regulator [Enterococcus hirae]EMF0072936.1 Rha family transcriptional regulator [Enterococcus hirae]EMF0111088.1 Rha family transcriptional regulator [Enterococcus hirae]EMF0133479.1 Rha family transcriptional regulator [Enterococcus hirae]EMF0454504.1 Rha family transcriptional regulator [Enterococcus hirae]
MKDLVFLQSDNLNNDPFTTDEVIAEYSENDPDSVKRLIRDNKADLEEFEVLGFEIRKPPKGSKGGRPKKVYHLNEQQATLLITFLDNTKPVKEFKKELVHQFYTMREELMTRRLERTKGKQIRCSMTDAIKEAGFSRHFYKHFTDLVYKKALGFNAKQLREAREANDRATPLDFLTTKEQAAVNQIEELVTSLIQLGRSYDEIKDILNVGLVLYQTTLKMPEMAH